MDGAYDINQFRCADSFERIRSGAELQSLGDSVVILLDREGNQLDCGTEFRDSLDCYQARPRHVHVQ